MTTRQYIYLCERNLRNDGEMFDFRVEEAAGEMIRVSGCDLLDDTGWIRWPFG